MILAVIFSIANLSAIAEQEVLLWLNAAILFLVVSGFIFYMTRRMSFWKKIGGIFGINRMVSGKFLKFFSEVMHYSGEKRILGQATAWSMFFAIIGVSLTNYVIFLSLGEILSMLDF
jgi:Na+/alanine symporter